MKSKRQALALSVSFVAVLALSAQLTAQHTRYKLIDIPALGGPVSSYFSGFGEGEQLLSDRGMLAGTADTSLPDPNCGNPDCFVSDGFRWYDGVITGLAALPGVSGGG